MSKQYTRAMLIETRAAESGAKRYRFRASTAGVARDGMVIPAGEWRLDNFKLNPVILASHDYYSLPIGRATDISTDDDGLIVEVEYDADDPVARDVMRKLDGGFMHAVSVGFRPTGIEYPTERDGAPIARGVDLLEISNVAVPSDPGALIMRSVFPDWERLLSGLANDERPDLEPTPTPDPDWSDKLARLEERLAALEAERQASDPQPAPEATVDPPVHIDLSRFPNLVRSS